VTKIFNKILRLAEFGKDLNRLSRKFRTLEEDLETFISNQLKLTHKLKIENKDVIRMSDLGIDYPHIYKARKFSCRALKGKGGASGIRIMYAYYPDKDMIEFIEIYYKDDQAKEDRSRILFKYSNKPK